MPQPIGCTLNLTDLAARGERWRELRRAKLERVELPTGLRIVFARSSDVERELTALVAGERACCAFASWDVRDEGNRIALEITAKGDGLRLIRSMFGDLGSAA